MRPRRATGTIVACLALGACSLNPPLRLAELAPTELPVVLDGVPFHPQERYHCGPATLLSALQASGVEAGYEEVVERVYVPGLEGSLQIEMTAAARSYGRVAYTPPGEVAAVLAEVDAGRPVLVLLNLGVPSRPTWHYALIVGFDPRRNRMLLHSGLEAASPQKARPWLRRWDWAGRWALVLLPPGEWPAAPQRDRLLDALAAFEETSTPEAAGRAWRRASEEWPDEPIAWLGVGNARFRQGDPSGAAEAFRRALALDPQDRAARLNLALALAQSGRPCEGLETLGAGPAADDALTDSFERLADRLAAECAARPGSPG